ncbi:multidrug transporter [Microtetraspora sp. NBRC 13810]|uniref:DMT family transporter n=1 Tax=Microtetraspora sp. NBRC 13810 TaxID=3030990 RepID=UPI0024A3E08C|nr:DMT family transporter [Microtetraspora sp. NBRC 13810]GLW08046.1 multidrug transporter [Microtetraspora sp. NBRC 13810]
MIGRTWTRVAVLALLWGSAFLWIRIALDHGLSPAQVTVARSAFGAAALLVLARLGGRGLPRDRATWGRLVVAAFFCNALPFLLFAVGVGSTSSGLAGVLNATTPLWSLLIGIAVGTDRGLRPVRLAGLLLGFAGTLLIFAPWQEGGPPGWGALAMLGGAASYAVAFAYMGRRLAGRGDPVALSAAQLLAATALSTPALAAGGAVPVQADLTALVAVVVLGVFSTGLTFYLNFRLIADEGATSAAVVGYLLPVVSVTLGALVLGEDLTLRVIAGMAVVLLGVGLSRRSPSHPAPPDTRARPRDHRGHTGSLTD